MKYSEQHNVCLYAPEEISRAALMVQGAKELGDWLAVPCTMTSMSQMAQLRLPAISPILREYDWPSNKALVPQPFLHQKVTASFMTLHPRDFNLNDMGTGKTLSTLWAYDYLRSKGYVHKALVMTPRSTMKRVWEDEIRKHFLGRLTSTILHGDAKTRLERLAEDVDVYIINHDGIGVGKGRDAYGRLQPGELAKILASRKDIDVVIIDELAVFRTASAQRYKMAKFITKDKPYVWGLTGGPTPNAPTDAHAQARLIRTDYTESFVQMRGKTMTKINDFVWKARNDAPEHVARVLSPSIRYSREQCIDLPPFTVSHLDVELSPGQKKAYEELKKTLRTQLENGQISAINEGTLRLKLIQVALGAVYGAEKTISKVDCEPRLTVLREIIESTEGKLLVFTPLVSVTEMVEEEVRSWGYSVAKVNGSVSQKRRDEIFLSFQQNDDPRIIVADPGTMAHGLTLTAAATIVWYGATDNHETYDQANARIRRPGQTKSMHIITIGATPVEQAIYRRLQDKEKMQGAILNLIKEN